jgi:hypothetical protein
MAEEKKQVYQSTTLGMPALRMVLVHARNDAQNAVMRALETPVQMGPAVQGAAPLDKQRAVRKIIEHLESIDG